MRRLCESVALVEGRSRRFELEPLQGRFGPVVLEGFALRVGGEVRAYVNVCPHRGQPVDLGDGKLVAPDGTLECQAHGAHFAALSGACVRGPCEGHGLGPVPIAERDGAVWLLPRDERVDDPEG